MPRLLPVFREDIYIYYINKEVKDNILNSISPYLSISALIISISILGIIICRYRNIVNKLL